MAAVPQFFPGLPDLPALAELKARRQWVAWRYVERNGRLTKPPVNPLTGGGASHSNPETWGSYEEAESRARRDHLPGVGYVISDGDEFTGADLDKCRNADTGQVEPWARDILSLAETYAEISPSGTGIRLIWRGKIAETVKCDPAHVELYHSLRYLTITGQHLDGVPADIRPAPRTWAALLKRVGEFRPASPAPAASTPATSDFFRNVNDKALRNLPSWVPSIFGAAAQFQFGTSAYRVSSKALGRDLEEDLSIAPNGIKDWGVHDIGDARQGRRTPIDIVMEYGMASSVIDAARWLCDRLSVAPDEMGWQESRPDPVAAESQRNLAALIPERPSRGPALSTDELSDLRIDGAYEPSSIGGLLGAVAQHILDTALFPVPDFACLASLTFGSALYGRRWVEPLMGGGLNIYAIATAPTGWGKDHPLQEPRQIAYRCEMTHLLGPDEFKSDAAIEKTLRKGPVRACFMDEIGIVLQANASKNASAWERKVRKALLQVYSASKGMWTGSQAAGDEGDKGSEPIHRPVLSIYGTSTPEELYKGLTEDNIRDGLFGRLIFAAPDQKPRRQRKPKPGDYDGLKDMTDAVRNFVPLDVPEKQRSLYHSGIRNALMPPAQSRVSATDDAIAALEMISDWQRDITEKEGDLSRIANRAAENAGKLATMRALSRDHADPEVTYEDAQWGWSLVERSLHIIARDIERHMVGSEYEGLVKAIRRHLEDAGKDGLKLAELIRRRGVSRAHHRDVNSVLGMMKDTGEIDISATNRGRRIRLI